MAAYRFIDLVTDAETITQVTSIRSTVKRLCNTALAYLCALFEWPFLWTTDWFQTTASYETGTVAVTVGSATVTGTSTVWTSAMPGRKFRIGGETAYYTIKSVDSATQITLDQLYEGTTATGAGYTIYKDEYLLRSDLDVEKRIRQSDNGYALFGLSESELDRYNQSQTATGLPSIEVLRGRAVKTYTTGTVSITSGTRTLTGVSTAWTSAEGVSKGTKLKVGTNIFTVNTVDSDTQITVYEVATATVSASAYTALLNNVMVQLSPIPTAVKTFYYRFQRQPAVLDADNDLPDLPEAMCPTILLLMLPFLWRQRGNMDRVVEAQNAAQQEIAVWKGKYNLPSLDRKAPLHPFSMIDYGYWRWANVTGQVGVPLNIS